MYLDKQEVSSGDDRKPVMCVQYIHICSMVTSRDLIVIIVGAER